MDELANALTHGLGLLLALAGVPVLIVLAVLRGTAWHVVGVAVYGVSLILLYGASTLYHALVYARGKRVLQTVDHAAIYLLIAGTYTPFALVNLRGAWGWTLLGIVWGVSLLGIVWKVFYAGRFAIISTALYIALGWVAIVAVKPLLRAVAWEGLLLIAAGGVAYTAGVIFFAAERWRFNHAVWHLFVIAGSLCHYFAVLRYVLPRS